MPSSDYGNAVGGGLKLKGAKGAGIKKKKRKTTTTKVSESEPKEQQQQSEGNGVLQKALAEEEKDDDGAITRREAEVKEYGKTEAQKRHEERRRKRVCAIFLLGLHCCDWRGILHLFWRIC